MGWWWNLTVEWPAMLGDWLWKHLVAMPLATLKELTLRRVLTVIALTILVAMFAQAAIPGDIALLLAGDTMAYYEAAAVIWLLATRGHLRDIARMMMRHVRTVLRLAAKAVPKVRRAQTRRRAPSQARRARRLGRSRGGEEEPRPRRSMPVRLPAAYVPSARAAAVRPRPLRRYRRS